MSKIWEALRQVERHKNKRIYAVGLERERRSTKRVMANAPILVYGHRATDDPFHEGTEALSANAGGALITLTTVVNPGQTLLLINKLNEKEEKCTVVRQLSTHLNRTAVAVRFTKPVPNFWDKTKAPVSSGSCSDAADDA